MHEIRNKIINQLIIIGLICLNYYIANSYYNYYKLTAMPDQFWIWDLPRYFTLITLGLVVMLTCYEHRTDYGNRFCCTKIMVFVPIYIYLLLNLGLNNIIISLTQTVQVAEAKQAIAFGYMLFIAITTTISYLSFSIEFIAQFKKETES